MGRTAFKGRLWQAYLVVGALCLGVFVYVDGKVFPQVDSHSAVANATSGSAAQHQKPDTAPSNQMINTLTKKLADVDGLFDMVVLPDGAGDGQFTVSAMVDLDTGESDGQSVNQQVNAAVDAYYQDIYTSQQPVSQAELTFMQDGNIVGQAGLGKNAYEKLAATTTAGNIATALMHGTQVAGDSANAAWLEVENS
ncbi:hypothetical protein [Alicyclobacillus fodiniaquatilis]|uniref:Uncharacterized protein n=1 Tax=Alicyclobacillus fodiniaquatilis TaxID=1661150 RepID=A0ABW4JFJ9_9BACL